MTSETHYRPVQIAGVGIDTNRSRDGRKVWLVSNLIEKAKGLEVFDLPLIAINAGHSVWSPVESAYDLAKHMKRVQDASLEHPVIMDQEGWIMDGWHRVAKALLEGRETIKAVRFDETPAPDFEDPA